MHIHPICGDEQHKCAFVASISRLTLSNIDPHSRHSRNLQVKLWATIWTLMPIGRTMARMCSARVKRPNGGGWRVREAPGGGVVRGPPIVSRETLGPGAVGRRAGGPGVREPEPPAMGPRAGGPESGRPQPEPFRTPPRRRAVSDVFFVYTVFSGSVLVAQARR